MSDIDDSLAMKVEYVKLLRNGHQIKITVPGLLSLRAEQDFSYMIPYLTYQTDFDAQSKPPEYKGGFLVDVTFEEDQQDDIPLTINFRENQLTVLMGTIMLPPVKIYSETLIEVVDGVVTGVVAGAIAVGGAGLFTMTLLGRLGPVFGLLDLLQIITLMVYINALYPIHVEIFFDKVMFTQLDWLPNWTRTSLTDILDSLVEGFEYVIVDQEAPYRFDFKELTASFLANGGQILTFQLLLMLLSVTINVLRKIFYGKFQKMAVLLGKIEQLMDINFFIRGYQGLSLPITIAVMIQLYNISTINIINKLSAALCFIGIIYMFIITFYIYKISMTAVKTAKFKELKRLASKFAAVFEGFNLKEKIGAYYYFLVYIKKYLLVYMLAFFQPVPEVQITILLLLYIANCAILFKYRPYLDKMTYIIANMSEIFLLMAHICASFYIYKIIVKPNPRDIIGWIIIVLLISTIMINLFLIIYIQIKERDEMIGQFKKLWTRLKNTCRTPRNTQRIKRIMTREQLKAKRRERLNQLEVKSLGFSRDKSEMLGRTIMIDAKLRSSIAASDKESAKGSISENVGITPSRRRKIKRTESAKTKRMIQLAQYESEAGSVKHQDSFKEEVKITENEEQDGQDGGFFDALKKALGDESNRSKEGSVHSKSGKYKEDIQMHKSSETAVVKIQPQEEPQLQRDLENLVELQSHTGSKD